MQPRARQRVAPVAGLAQVPGALGPVGLDPQADAAHPGDAHHVVSADLEPVKRLLDRRLRPGQVAPAHVQLRPQRAVEPDPLWLVGHRHEVLGGVEARGRAILVADAERHLGSDELAEDVEQPGGAGGPR